MEKSNKTINTIGKKSQVKQPLLSIAFECALSILLLLPIDVSSFEPASYYKDLTNDFIPTREDDIPPQGVGYLKRLCYR